MCKQNPPSLLIIFLWLSLGLGGCVSTTVRVVDMTPPEQAATTLSEEQLLDVGIAVFDPNVPTDYDERIKQLILPEVRNTESQYIPYFLKNLLQATGNWGAVRVVPRPTHAVDVTVNGKILRSDGSQLDVEVTVTDATGREWFTHEYSALASKYSYEAGMPANVDAFNAVYKNIANDMLAFREVMTEEETTNIRRIAELKFAQEFSSEAFAEHVQRTPAGLFELQRMPSESDPMLARVRKIREREYLFIDTLDEYYTNFYRQMYPSYQSWRSASYEQIILYEQLRAQSKSRVISGTLAIVGGVASIYESDNGYVDAGGLVGVLSGATLIGTAINKRHEAAMEAEKLREMGSAVEAELIPTTIELENQSARLEGNVSQQYDQLRQILRKVYFEDLNLAPPELPDTEGKNALDSAALPQSDSQSNREGVE